jgi:competence protein ComFB
VNFKNYMEDVVSDVYQELLNRTPELCKCDRCRQDVIALALTRLHGKYAVSAEGEIFAKLSREDRQVRATALVEILEAVKTVKEHPNH